MQNSILATIASLATFVGIALSAEAIRESDMNELGSLDHRLGSFEPPARLRKANVWMNKTGRSLRAAPQRAIS